MVTKKAGREEELEASKEAVRDALDKLLEAKAHFQNAAESAGLDVKDEAIEHLAKGKVKAEQLGDEASAYINEKPLQTLSFAFVGGFILAHLLSSK